MRIQLIKQVLRGIWGGLICFIWATSPNPPHTTILPTPNVQDGLDHQ